MVREETERVLGSSFLELNNDVRNAPARNNVNVAEEYISPFAAPGFNSYFDTAGNDVIDLGPSGIQYINVGGGSDVVTLFGGAITANSGLYKSNGLTSASPDIFAPNPTDIFRRDLLLNPRVVDLGSDDFRDVVRFKDITDGWLLNPGTFYGLGDFAIIKNFRASERSIADGSNDRLSLPGPRGAYDIVYDGQNTNVFYNNALGVQGTRAGLSLGIPTGSVHIATIESVENLERFTSPSDGVFEFGA